MSKIKTNKPAAEKKAKKQATKTTETPSLFPKAVTKIGLELGFNRLKDFNISFTPEFKNKDRIYIGVFENPIEKFRKLNFARYVVVDKLSNISAGDFVALRVAGVHPNDELNKSKFHIKEFAGTDAKGSYYFYDNDSKDRKLEKCPSYEIEFMHRITHSFNCNWL